MLEIAPKDEEQSLDEFLEGARDAVAFVAPRLKDAVAHEAELSKVVSAQLLNKAKEGSIAISDSDDSDEGEVRRVTFGVFGSRLRQKDLAPRSTGAMALFEQALQKWGYAAEARDDAILLRSPMDCLWPDSHSRTSSRIY